MRWAKISMKYGKLEHDKLTVHRVSAQVNKNWDLLYRVHGHLPINYYGTCINVYLLISIASLRNATPCRLLNHTHQL